MERYPICVLVAMNVLKQTNIYCMNVKMSKKYGILKFDVSWKHIVVGFDHEMNEKAIKFTNLISFLALRIYKYKMRCRIEKK